MVIIEKRKMKRVTATLSQDLSKRHHVNKIYGFRGIKKKAVEKSKAGGHNIAIFGNYELSS